MVWNAVKKQPEAFEKHPHLADYADTLARFSWDAIRGELAGLPEGRGLNIAHEAVDRHADGGLYERVAIRWLGSNGSSLTGKYVMDFHPDDVFWCTAEPGWVTGTSYGIILPLLNGITNIVDEADFDAMRWCEILASQKVSVWYTAPTAIRRFMRLGFDPAKTYDLRHLRLIHSVGEPLNPEAVVWGLTAMGMPIHDNWWQTETVGIMIANFPAMEIRT